MHSANANGRPIFRISASAEKDIKNLPPAQQKHIADQLKLPETLNMRKVAGVRHGDLYRLRFSGVIRAAVKKDDHYYVIFHVGRKVDIENLYATYRRNEVCREARRAVPLEQSCLRQYLVPPTPESLIDQLKADLDGRLMLIEKAESDLAEALDVLDLTDREHQSSLDAIQQAMSAQASAWNNAVRAAEQRIAELELRLETSVLSRVRVQLDRLFEAWLRIKLRLRRRLALGHLGSVLRPR